MQSGCVDSFTDRVNFLQYFLLFFSGILVGRLFDLGFFRITFTVGCVLLVFSQMMLSLCKTYWQIFLAQGIGLGLSFGIIFNLAVNCPAHFFSKRRALAYGFVASGSSIGGTIFPIMINRLLVQVGYPWTMRIVGFLALALCILASVGLSTRLQPSIDVRDKSKGGWKQVHFFDFAAFKLPAYTFFVFGSTAILFGLYTPFTYMDVFTRSYALPASGYYLSILNAASTFGRILPGIIADRAGRINTILPHLAVSSVLLFIYPLCNNLAGIIIFSILYGFASGAYVSLIPACVSQLGSTHTVGQRVGMMFMISSIGALLGQPISGAILGTGPYRWWPTCVFSAVMVAVGTALIALSRHFALGRNIKGKI